MIQVDRAEINIYILQRCPFDMRLLELISKYKKTLLKSYILLSSVNI